MVVTCPQRLIQRYDGIGWVEPLPFSDTPVMRKSRVHLAGFVWPAEANSLGARLPRALWGR